MPTEARKATLARRIRSSGGRWFRKLGLLPEGVADGLGQDAALTNAAFAEEIIVYFPDTPGSLALLTQWYPALRQLNEEHPVIIVVQDSRTERLVAAESQLPVLTIAHYGTLDGMLSRSRVRMALYVSNHPWNFSMLRFTSPTHVLLIGRGAKLATFGNQVKAYDFSFVDGEDLIVELQKSVPLYDPQRCITMGAEDSSSDDSVPRGFAEACTRALDLGSLEWARVRANGAVGP